MQIKIRENEDAVWGFFLLSFAHVSSFLLSFAHTVDLLGQLWGTPEGVLLICANNAVSNELYFFALRERAFFGRPKKVRKKRPFKDSVLKDPVLPSAHFKVGVGDVVRIKW